MTPLPALVLSWEWNGLFNEKLQIEIEPRFTVMGSDSVAAQEQEGQQEDAAST